PPRARHAAFGALARRLPDRTDRGLRCDNGAPTAGDKDQTMSARTDHGLTLRAQRSRRPPRPLNRLVFFVIFVAFVIFVPERQPWRVTAQAPQAGQPPTQAQQRPVFRGGTHFVRVDAYPTTPDGKIVEGLKPEDFEILEDGKPQAIESFD